MTESTESAGEIPVLDGGVLEKGFFTGPVSAAGDAPLRSIAGQPSAAGDALEKVAAARRARVMLRSRAGKATFTYGIPGRRSVSKMPNNA
jgi:hypothetical protein